MSKSLGALHADFLEDLEIGPVSRKVIRGCCFWYMKRHESRNQFRWYVEFTPTLHQFLLQGLVKNDFFTSEKDDFTGWRRGYRRPLTPPNLPLSGEEHIFSRSLLQGCSLS